MSTARASEIAEALVLQTFSHTEQAIRLIAAASENPVKKSSYLEAALVLVNHKGLHADWDLVYRIAGIERNPDNASGRVSPGYFERGVSDASVIV